MARYAKLVHWLSNIELLEWLRQAKDKQEYQRRVAIWLTHLRHFPAHQVANMLGVSTQAIWLWISQYNHHRPRRIETTGTRRSTLGIYEYRTRTGFIKFASTIGSERSNSNPLGRYMGGSVRP